MADILLIFGCLLFVVAALAYAGVWLIAVADLLWMTVLHRWTVLGSLVTTGFVANLLTSWLLPSQGLPATRLAIAFIVAPIPARMLADFLGWRAIPKVERPPFKVGAMFDRAFAKRQAAFIQTLAEQGGNPDRDV